MHIQPYLLGRGRAGEAIEKALAMFHILEPQFEIRPIRYFERTEKLQPADPQEFSALFLANPHGLHAMKIFEAAQAGFKIIFSEKPLVVDQSQIDLLSPLQTPVAVFHGYRVMWGPQTLKKLLNENFFGPIISIEARYWQSSSAQKAVDLKYTPDDWKNKIELAGTYDTYLDLGSHWMDMLLFLASEVPQQTRSWISHTNSEAAHRDTHVHMDHDFAAGWRATASISKTAHGYGNFFEIIIHAARHSARWNFQEPDRIYLGEGREMKTLSRADSDLGSKQSPNHATGWLEGYIEVIRRGLISTIEQKPMDFPNLKSSLAVIQALLNAEMTRVK